MRNDNEKYIEVAKSATISAGKYLANNFEKKQDAHFKSENDIGLIVDSKSEQIILNIIRKEYPKHNFYSEEIGEIKNKSKFTWYIDPLDGTNNYFAGIPYFSVSIALLFENEIILGIVYNPISNQLFEAVKGGGAFLNDKRILSSKSTIIKKSVCSFIQGHAVSTSKVLAQKSVAIQCKLSTSFRRTINTWSPALDWALLATGGIDALVSFESEFEDMYAGILIAKEAGINVSNFRRDEFTIGDTRIVASNDYLKENLFELLEDFE